MPLNSQLNDFVGVNVARWFAIRCALHRKPECAWLECLTTNQLTGALAAGGAPPPAREISRISLRPELPAGDVIDTAYRAALASQRNSPYQPAMLGGLTGAVTANQGANLGPIRALSSNIEGLPIAESTTASRRPVDDEFAGECVIPLGVQPLIRIFCFSRELQ